MKKFFTILLCLTAFGCATSNNGTIGKNVIKNEEAGTLMINRYYELIGINNNGEFVLFEPGHGGAGLIKFNANGSFEATSGINNGFGKYTYKNTHAEFATLTIDSLGVTRMASENAQANAFDVLFFGNLDSCKFIAIEGTVIKLFDAQKNEQMRFYLRG